MKRPSVIGYRAPWQGAVVLAALSLVGCGSSTSSSTQPTTDQGGAPPAESAAKGDAVSGDMAIVLREHNKLRAQHCAPALAWSNEIAASAQGWADALAKNNCAFEHSESAYGENLAMGSDSIMGPEQAVALWYQEKSAYDFKAGGFSLDAGHFTQLAWIGSQRMGCGRARCDGQTIWVCNYDPPGNMEGQFQANVKPKGCR